MYSNREDGSAIVTVENVTGSLPQLDSQVTGLQLAINDKDKTQCNVLVTGETYSMVVHGGSIGMHQDIRATLTDLLKSNSLKPQPIPEKSKDQI